MAAFYVFEFNVLPGVPEATPTLLEKSVMDGRLDRLDIIIPNGHQGLARLRVETRSRAIVPTPGSDPMWIRGDGNTISVEPDLDLDGPEWVLRFLGWNADVLIDHSFIIHAHISRKTG